VGEYRVGLLVIDEQAPMQLIASHSVEQFK
jgi:hypothetical protein